QVVSPMQSVIFPKFSALVAQGKKQELIALYHKSCRWMAILVFPVGFILIFFAKEILLLWTNNPVLSQNTAPILQVFALGTICNCMMVIPYFYLLANGNTKFTIYQNIIASVILVPLLFWWTSKYGAIGASYVWLSVNAGYVLLSIPLFYKWFLVGEYKNWLLNDIAIPLISALFLTIVIKYVQLWLLPSTILTIPYLAFLLAIMAGIYSIVIPDLRKIYKKRIFKW
ncbi:MAG: polysaccharide biosynthesis protein, partial [Flavobacterium sp.]